MLRVAINAMATRPNADACFFCRRLANHLSDSRSWLQVLVSELWKGPRTCGDGLELFRSRMAVPRAGALHQRAFKGDSRGVFHGTSARQHVLSHLSFKRVYEPWLIRSLFFGQAGATNLIHCRGTQELLQRVEVGWHGYGLVMRFSSVECDDRPQRVSDVKCCSNGLPAQRAMRSMPEHQRT